MPDNVKVLLVGCGNMGKEYMKVLSDMSIETIVVGRSEKGTKEFENATGKKALAGGIENILSQLDSVPDMAIVAVGTMVVKETMLFLINNGVKRILVEKPAGMNLKEIEDISRAAKEYGVQVYVAYNRRYYSSVEKAINIIGEDGGVDSFNFEFTEWGHVLRTLGKPQEELDQWFLLNSSHVIDLAFYLGGKPKNIACFTGGKNVLDWHTKCSKYAGAGITENGALFSYQANYGAPGRWGVEILTKKHRLYFRPMEKLQICNIGSVQINDVEIEDTFDIKFKPGLYKEVLEFVNGENMKIPTIEEQVENCKLYELIECETNE